MKLLTLALAGMLAGMVNAQTNDFFIAPTSGWYQITASNICMLNTNREYTQTNEFTLWNPRTSNDYIKVKNWASHIPALEITNAVNDLAASGDICRVKGHNYPQYDGRFVQLLFSQDGCETIFYECKICGKIESKTKGEWR